MRLKLTLRRPPGPADLLIDVDSSVTVGALSAAIARSDPAGGAAPASSSLMVEGVAQASATLDPHLTITEAGLGSGQFVTVVPARSTTSPSAAVLNVIAGPDAGKAFDLTRGLNTVGRRKGCDVRLTDPMVSQHHAKVIVGDTVEIVDDNSSNGILVGTDRVERVVLQTGDNVVIGDSVITVVARHGTGATPAAATGGVVEFNRSPRVDPQWEGLELEAPELPQINSPQRFPLITAIVPLFMGFILFAITKSLLSILFVGMSPLMIVGGYFENKRAAKAQLVTDTELFRENLAALVVELHQAQDAERLGRNAEHPSTGALVSAVRLLEPLVWTRRPEHDAFLSIRLGLGRQPSRTTVELPRTRTSLVELQRELHAAVEPYLYVDQVPVLAELRSCGSFGVSGPEPLRSDVARGLVAQVVAMHSPAEVVIVSMASPNSARQWDWMKWLPHVGGDHYPLEAAPLASTAPACLALVSELADLVATRGGEGERRSDGPTPLPAVLLLVEDDAPVERSAVVALMEQGRDLGVHVMWSAPTTALIPAAARTFLEVDAIAGAATGKVIEAEAVHPIVVEPLDLAGAEWFARRLAPVVDAGASVDSASDVPRSVSFLTEVGMGVAQDKDVILDRWRESNSLRPKGGAVRSLKRDNTLRAFVGRSAMDPLHLDLRTQGPHALVGGTTGAGKSEFLQTWVLGMAASHSPQRVTFLFVDYKGGSAFADCITLPHTVGLVTDLSPHLVQRALVSLNAELHHREKVLNRKKAKDLLELERRGDPACPPSLVIVVDEFAALVQEVPEFVDGVVNVAQRGRSLGLHLILATQRPAGVIKDNLRANTNLRVALRMADEDDSKDVVGSTLAGTFDPGIPGRGVVKTGPGRLTLFQSGYVGGWTSGEDPPPRLQIATLAFGGSQEWEQPEPAGVVPDADLGPPDIRRVVKNVIAAADAADLEAPRKPWLPELAPVYGLEHLPNERRDQTLVFGVVDLPERQAQDVVSFQPDVDGNIAVFGTGGSGKSAFLRSLAISAGLTARSGPCFVYALDFGSRGLSMLEALPHVGAVIGADDTERTARLVTQVRQMIDERAVRYAAVDASTVEEYRRIGNQPDEPRILLLVDGFSAFRTAYETGPSARILDLLMSLAVDGRPVGVHLALSGDRVGAVPAGLAGSIQRRLALRLSNDMDEAMLGVPRDGFGEITPPGRGFLGGLEVQVAVVGGAADVAAQAAAVRELAKSMEQAGAPVAPPIERLADDIDWASLPATAGGLPTFGVADETLGPLGFTPAGMLLVTGPAGSGRTTTVRTMIAALRAARPDLDTAYFGTGRSPLVVAPWTRKAVGAAEAARLAEEISRELGEPGEDRDRMVVVIDGLGDFLNSEADFALQDLLKACRAAGVLVIADGESSDIVGSWPLLQAIKAPRHGIVLQPDQADGDTIFRTPFPRVARAEFPTGRGLYVRAGKAYRVQVARTREELER